MIASSWGLKVPHPKLPNPHNSPPSRSGTVSIVGGNHLASRLPDDQHRNRRDHDQNDADTEHNEMRN